MKNKHRNRILKRCCRQKSKENLYALIHFVLGNIHLILMDMIGTIMIWKDQQSFGFSPIGWHDMLGDFILTLLQQLGFNLSHFQSILPAGLLVNDDALGVVLADQATGFLLNVKRCQPRLVDVFDRVFGQLWHIASHVVSPGVCCSAKCSGINALTAVESLFESWTGDPHPVTSVDGPVS